MSDKEILCVRCAKLGKTCCQQKRDIYVTPGDVQRIRDYTKTDNFYEFRKAANLEYEDQDDDPIWLRYVFRSDRSRRVLKRDVLEDCMFLGKNGCALPIEVRPLVCRLHPHTYNADSIYPEIEKDCPLDLLNPGETIADVIAGFQMENARQWHHMLYSEILLEKPKS